MAERRGAGWVASSTSDCSCCAASGSQVGGLAAAESAVDAEPSASAAGGSSECDAAAGCAAGALGAAIANPRLGSGGLATVIQQQPSRHYANNSNHGNRSPENLF